MKNALLLVALALIALAPAALAQDAPQTLLLRQPDISDDHLVFVYAGDLWIAGRDGSAPRRLTAGEARETNPVFSPDGRHVAFAAAYENNVDVYVISVEGGQPRRLTWHPEQDVPTGWTRDGRAVTFVSPRETDHGRSGQLFHAPVDGGLPLKSMEARVFQGVYDADDARFAYISFRPAYNGLFGGSTGWKGYAGGTAPEIRVMDLKSSGAVSIEGGGATHFNPLWLDGTLYFLADREGGLFNLYRWSGEGAPVKVSDETVWDIRAASGHGGVIVYEAGGRLFTLDPATGARDEIVVSIRPDLPELRPQWKDASRTIQAVDISPTGKRVVVTARGDVFTVPVKDGSTRNLTDTDGRREYGALWSPEGGSLAYIIESRDGQQLAIVGQDGVGEPRLIDLGPHFYDLMAWSGGDDPRILLQDNHLTLYTLRVEDGKLRQVAAGARREQIEASFSPDGRWLAYTLEQPNFNRDLVLLNLDSGKSTTVTDGTADVASPAFSRDGKLLFFAASTNAGPLQVGLNMTSQERPYRAGLYALVLAADGESPLTPAAGDEEVKKADEDEDEDDDKKSDKKDKKDEKKDADATVIDLDGLAGRMVALPVAEANYGNLAVAHDGNLYYVESSQPGATVEPPGGGRRDSALMRFDLEDKKDESLLDGVSGFRVSADGKHLLLSQGRGRLKVAEVGKKLDAESVDLGGVRMHVDPRREWALIFDEVWRMEKEYFYDPAMHGLDWDAVYDRYRPLVDHAGSREDLNDVLTEMIAEMQVGHNYVGGGDGHRDEGVSGGLLGANFVIEDGRYRLARIYTGERWNPFLDAPLAAPGNEAREGEFILAVNGRDLTAGDNIHEWLQGTVGTQVTLRVGPRADGKDARDIVVVPSGREGSLRLWRWIEDNRRRVDEATDGRVGYIYLPNTAGAGYTLFNRMFFAQVDKEALIIDERANGGGQAANYITDVLSRRHLSGWKDRDGMVYNTPAGAHYGPKIMLIDQDAGSGGDFLPYSFRHLGIGTLMGTRTWGGLIGISANPQLTDGGYLTVPFFRFYDADHQWTVENQGVAPDIEVDLDPAATNRGVDSQLEAAIVEVMAQLKGFENPVPTEAPAYPTELGK